MLREAYLVVPQQVAVQECAEQVRLRTVSMPVPVVEYRVWRLQVSVLRNACVVYEWFPRLAHLLYAVSVVWLIRVSS